MTVKLKNIIWTYWPLGFILALWLAFSSPYFIKGLVPFPSKYLVTFFPPWNTSYGMPVKNNAMPDIVSQIYPWKMLTINEWKHGHIPLWNPYAFSGTVHAGNYQTAVFTPFNLLFFILPFIDAWSMLVLIQPLLAGLFTYVFVLRLVKIRIPSVMSAVAFMFSGFIVTWMGYGTLAHAVLWLPIILWAVERECTDVQTWVNGVVITLALAASFFSGHFQISLYVLGTTLLYTIYRAATERKPKTGILIGAYILLGMLVALPQIWLTFDAFMASNRGGSIQRGEVIPWQYLVTLFAPDFYGNPVTRNDWFGHYAEWSSYIGGIPLIMSAYGMWGWRDRKRLFFVVLTVVSLCFAYPTPLNALLYDLKIPVLSTSAASRIIVLTSFSLAVLSAFGLADMMRDMGKRSVRRMLYWIASVLFIVSVIALVVFVFRPFAPDKLSIAKRNLVIPMGITVLGMALISIAFFLPRTRSVILAALLLISAFDSYRFASKWMPFDPRQYVYPPYGAMEKLKGFAGDTRVFGNIGNEAAIPFGIQLIEGYDAMYQGRYARFINSANADTVNDGGRSVVEFDQQGKYRDRILPILGVRYILHRISDGANVWAFPVFTYPASVLPSVYKDSGYEIFEYKNALPRVFLASSYGVRTGDRLILDTLKSPSFDPATTLVLETDPGLKPATGRGTASISSYGANEVVVRTESSVPKMLFISDTYDPGWKAQVDTADTKVYRADYDFRAVFVPAGKHTVTFSYRPRGAVTGIPFALAGLVALAVLSLYRYANRNL